MLGDEFALVSARPRTCLPCPAQSFVHVFSSAPQRPPHCGKLVTTSVAVTFMDANQREFVSVSVQAFFQRDTDPAIPCPGSASWIRLWHSCRYLEHGLPGRTGDNAVHAWEVTDTGQGQHVLGTHQ